jgi:hypothetical protein
MSRIDKLELNLRDASAAIKRSRGGDTGAVKAPPKSFGEKPPKALDITKDPFLMSLWSARGLIGRLGKKIRDASKKRGKIIPAADITAMAMPHIPDKQEGDVVFLGTDFVLENLDRVDAIAGVLCHEWGHLVSEFLHGHNPEELNFDEINGLRREEEGYADAYAGRLLYLIGHKPFALIEHLAERSCGHTTDKYHDMETRAAIIIRSYAEQIRMQEQGAKFFAREGESSIHTSRIIAVA